MNYLYIIYTNSAHTSQETHYFSATKTNSSKLLKETVPYETHKYTLWTECRVTVYLSKWYK
jgi:hypothetical protein